ncbi:MAG: hypothetical protein SOU95_00475 [Candidatus Cryptobacteroides sp.]|nr:hypothetical protein [Bacteroidales bacterium]MDY2772985.1 hypothetical protein [Candidatus Cryptobacteroides sp.]
MKTGLHILELTALVAILFSASACEWAEQVISGEVVASVGKSRLYRSDLNKVLPSGLSADDSTRLAHQYINTWASDVIFLNIAEKQLSDAELDVTKELEDYRKSLLKYRYEQRYINDRLDTLVTEAQIDEYYRKHPEKFVLQVPVVRADFLCISPESPSLAEFRRNIVSDDVPQMQITDSLAYSSAIKYENFGGRWIDMTVLAKEFGLDYAELMTFRKGEWIERSGDTGLLSIAYIREFVPAGKLAPIGYATPLIRDILLSTRKRELVSNLEQDLLEQARENGKFEIY